VKQAGGPGVSGTGFVTTDSALAAAIAADGASYFGGNFVPPATFGKGETGQTVLDAGQGYQLFVAKLLP
jgi:hypothetical protein